MLQAHRYQLGALTVIEIEGLPDRRLSNAPTERWLLGRHVETALYGDAGTGALLKLLGRCSLAAAPLTVNKKAVADRLVTQQEYDTIVGWLTESLPLESQGRVRQVMLIAKAHAITCAQKLGRGEKTQAFLRCLAAPLPRLWEALNEQEANHAAMETDLLLEEEIEDLEEEECSFVAELSAVYVPFDQSGEEETAPPSWKLERVPEGLKGELADFTKHRTDPLVRAREGTACVDITVGNDKATVLRFFGWLFATHSITPGLGVFCRPTLSQWAEEWLRALRDKGCRFSTLANYANSLAMVGSFVYSTYKLDDETLAMPTSPLDEILRLRSQSESQAKHEGLYTKRHADWISWEEAQRARISAEQKYKSLPSAPHAKKTQALREWLAIGLFTLMPPDRVGVIRKLRLNMSLKRSKGGAGFELDLTQQRAHKSSKFHGPTISSFSAMLSEPLSLYVTQLEFNSAATETPYVFYPVQSGDTTRCLPSSQWSQFIKGCFRKHTEGGKAPPPKLLRASFISWLRDSTDAPTVLASAAKCMRHQTATQESNHYDKGHHDRLMAAAVQFNEKFASNYVAAPIAAPAAGSWVSVSGTFIGKLAAQQPPGEAHRLFVLSVPYDPAVDSYLVPGAEVRFPIVPGAEANSVVCTLPLVDKWPSSKCAFTFPVKLSKEGATSDVVTINGMEVRAPAAEGEAGEEEAAAEEEGGGDETLVDAPAEEEAGAAAEEAAGAEAEEAAVHVPVPSQFGTPVLVADIHARLCVEPKLCAENGDCFPLSSMCGFELTADKVEAPDADTTEAVRVSRDASVGILVGDDPIGGIAASTLRKEEGVEEATFREKMAPWRSSYHWATAEAKLSAAFMFSLAVHLERTVIVLETTPDGEKYIDPARAYGMRDDSELRRTPERRGKEETIPFYFMIKLADLPTVLRAQACSLLQYDREGVHFQPLVRDIAWTEEMGREEAVVDDAGEELTDEEMNATMRRLELVWKDEKQTAMIGTTNTYELIDRVESFLDTRLKVDAMTVIIPGVRRFDFSRSEFGQRSLSCMTSADPPGGEMGDVMGDEDEMGELGGDDPGGEMGEPIVHETPPELQPALPMAPNRPTIFASAQSLAGAAAAVETVAEAVPERVEAVVAQAVPVAVPAEAAAPPRKRATKAETAAKAAEKAKAKAEKDAAKEAARAAEAAVAAAKKAGKEAAKPVRQSRKRKAATVAAAAIAGEDQELDEDALAPRAVRAKAAPEPTREQTMEECLSGKFSHLKAAVPAPTWLADALEKDPSRLHGSLMAFHWEGWGWHVGRLGDTSAEGCNYSALYLDKWREDHALFASDYGTGGVGNWVLLEGTPPPILDFHAGKYRVKRDGVDVWLRAEDMVEYSGSDLAAAREMKRDAVAEASQEAVDAELDTGGFAIGRRVFAKGLGGDGEVAWFVAQVIGHRERFPPLQIKYLATHPDGDTSALALPVPRLVFAPATHLRIEEPAE